MSALRRIGLVGYGAIAENAYGPALDGLGVSIEAVAEVSAPRRSAATLAAPSARVYASLGELLAREKSRLDALIVTTPPAFHTQAVLAGLASGLHVLCEKPLTLDLKDHAAISAAARRQDRCVYSVNNWAFSPQWSKLLALAASGRLGRLRQAELRVRRTRPSVSALPGDWRRDPALAGGGILVDHGWHNLYLLRRLLGSELELVETELLPEGGVDQETTVRLRGDGSTGKIELTWRASERSNTAFVSGDQGTARLLDDAIVVKTNTLDETIRFPEKLSAGSAHPAWLASMWPAFEAECAGRGRGASLAEAGACLRLIRQAYGAREEAALG